MRSYLFPKLSRVKLLFGGSHIALTICENHPECEDNLAIQFPGHESGSLHSGEHTSYGEQVRTYHLPRMQVTNVHRLAKSEREKTYIYAPVAYGV